MAWVAGGLWTGIGAKILTNSMQLRAMRVFLAVFFFALACWPLETQAFTGEDLVRLCDGEQVMAEFQAGAPSKSVCKFYIRGVIDHASIHAEFNPESLVFCVSTNISIDYLRLAFLEWASSMEDLETVSAGKSLVTALIETYPCSAPE